MCVGLLHEGHRNSARGTRPAAACPPRSARCSVAAVQAATRCAATPSLHVRRRRTGRRRLAALRATRGAPGVEPLPSRRARPAPRLRARRRARLLRSRRMTGSDPCPETQEGLPPNRSPCRRPRVAQGGPLHPSLPRGSIRWPFDRCRGRPPAEARPRFSRDTTAGRGLARTRHRRPGAGVFPSKSGRKPSITLR